MSCGFVVLSVIKKATSRKLALAWFSFKRVGQNQIWNEGWPKVARHQQSCSRAAVGGFQLLLSCALDCKDKDRLLFEYNRRVQESSQAAQRLSEQAGASHSGYLILLSRVDEARAKTQRAKAAYATHVEEHGC